MKRNALNYNMAPGTRILVLNSLTRVPRLYMNKYIVLAKNICFWSLTQIKPVDLRSKVRQSLVRMSAWNGAVLSLDLNVPTKTCHIYLDYKLYIQLLRSLLPQKSAIG
jgi:hypothetical protein